MSPNQATKSSPLPVFMVEHIISSTILSPGLGSLFASWIVETLKTSGPRSMNEPKLCLLKPSAIHALTPWMFAPLLILSMSTEYHGSSTIHCLHHTWYSRSSTELMLLFTRPPNSSEGTAHPLAVSSSIAESLIGRTGVSRHLPSLIPPIMACATLRRLARWHISSRRVYNCCATLVLPAHPLTTGYSFRAWRRCHYVWSAIAKTRCASRSS